MTDNRTTELLCKLLEERGVSYQTNYLHTVWYVGPKLYDALNNLDGTLTVSNLTPEQAIAATLGSERIAELEAENERLRKAGYEIGYHDAMKAAKRGGALTAEQVLTIAGKHQLDYCSDTHVCFDWQAISDELNSMLGGEINGETSDGYHTFNELYHHRAVLFGVIVRDHRELAWKARKHHDGTMYDGMFIVGIETPKGQATYHYDLDPYWEMFDCEEREYAPEWDGHTPDEAIARIAELGSRTCELAETDCYSNANETIHVLECSACGETCEHVNGSYPRCPHCGARVKEGE